MVTWKGVKWANVLVPGMACVCGCTTDRSASGEMRNLGRAYILCPWRSIGWVLGKCSVPEDFLILGILRFICCVGIACGFLLESSK